MVDGLRNPSDMRQIFGKGIYKGRLKGTTKAEPDRARELRAKGLKVSEDRSGHGDEQADSAEVSGGVTTGGNLTTRRLSREKSRFGSIGGGVPGGHALGFALKMSLAFLAAGPELRILVSGRPCSS